MTSSLRTIPSTMGTPGQRGPASKNLASRKMGQAYLEHSIAELESQLREARLKPSSSSSSSKSKDKSKAPCLLDVSMLVYALPVVRKWARSDDYAELLLPIDGMLLVVIAPLTGRHMSTPSGFNS